MSKKITKSNQPVEDSNRLHIELSSNAVKALASIRRLKLWNKKTAVETALCFYHLHGERVDLAGGAK